MEKNQKINCNIYTCAFNNKDREICELNEINVCACPGCNNGTAEDESMCGSYEHNHTQQ